MGLSAWGLLALYLVLLLALSWPLLSFLTISIPSRA